MKIPSLFLFALLLVLTGCGDKNPAEATDEAPAGSGDPGIDNVTAGIRQDSTNADLYAQRATMYFDKRNYEAAIADMERALAIDSTNVVYHYNLADVYVQYYRSRLALRTLQRAATLDPDNVETHLRLSKLHLTLEQYDEAIEAVDEVVRLDARNALAFYYLSSAFLGIQDTARAIKAAEEATEIDPDFTDAYLRMGRLLDAKGLPRAEQYFSAAVSINPLDPIPLQARGDFYRDNDRIEDAKAAYREAVIADRQHVSGYFNRGLLLMEQDSVEQALAEFNLVLKNDPVHIQGYFFRGFARELLGNAAGARDDYRIALRYAPDYTLAQEGLARVGETE